MDFHPRASGLTQRTLNWSSCLRSFHLYSTFYITIWVMLLKYEHELTSILFKSPFWFPHQMQNWTQTFKMAYNVLLGRPILYLFLKPYPCHSLPHIFTLWYCQITWVSFHLWCCSSSIPFLQLSTLHAWSFLLSGQLQNSPEGSDSVAASAHLPVSLLLYMILKLSM